MKYVFFGLAVFLGAVAGLISGGFLAGAMVGIIASALVFPWHRRSFHWLVAFLAISTAISFSVPRFFIGTSAAFALGVTVVSTILFFLTLRIGRRWAAR